MSSLLNTVLAALTFLGIFGLRAHSFSAVDVPPREVIIMDAEGQRLDAAIGTYDEGSDLVLICEAEGGKPLPSLTWWQDNHMIDEDYTVLEGSRVVRNELRVSNIQRSDLLKKFMCRASNSDLVTPREVSATLDINLPPLDVSILEPKNPFNAGHRAEIVCLSSGSRPPAQITWSKGGVDIKGTDVRQTLSQDGNVSISTLTFIVRENDNGIDVACRASNGELTKGTSLVDTILLSVYYVPQVRITLEANIDKDEIREGTDVYFECIVGANPWVSEINWMFDGSPLFSDPSQGIIISNQSLVLQKVRRQSRGQYWCSAFNSQGQGDSEEFFLKVLFAPVCRSGRKSTYGVARNELVQVTCDVDADPANVSFRWMFNNSDTHIEIRSFVDNGSRSLASFVPSPPRTYGNMVCWGENSIGRQKEPCVFDIIPASPPEAVHSCSVRNQSFSSLLLDCKPGDNGGLRQVFFLEVYNSGAQKLHANISTVYAPEFLVQNLPPGTRFTLNIYAANSKGRSSSLMLDASTLSLTQKQTKVHFLDETIVTPLVGILIGSITTVVLLTVLVVACLKFKGRNSHEPIDTPSRPKKTTPNMDSFDRMDPHAQHYSTMPDEAGFYKHSGEAQALAAFHTADHYQVAFKARPDVTYAELTLAPCETLLGPRKTEAGLSAEYAQLDFERANKFRTIICGCETGLEEALRRNRSPVADGCSETEVASEASIEHPPLIDGLKPANYHHAHDVIIRRVSPAHLHTSATTV